MTLRSLARLHNQNESYTCIISMCVNEMAFYHVIAGLKTGCKT